MCTLLPVLGTRLGIAAETPAALSLLFSGMWPGEVEGVPWGLPECTPRCEVVMLVVGDPGANFQPPRQQDDAVEWLLPLLRWHQCLLPLQHHLGRHRLRLPLCAGHFHHHPAGHPRKGGKWRGWEGSAPCWVHPMCHPFPASTADPGANVPLGQGPADGQGCGISSEPRGQAPAQLPCRTPQPQIYRQPRSELGKFSVRFSLNDFTG